MIDHRHAAILNVKITFRPILFEFEDIVFLRLCQVITFSNLPSVHSDQSRTQYSLSSRLRYIATSTMSRGLNVLVCHTSSQPSTHRLLACSLALAINSYSVPRFL